MTESANNSEPLVSVITPVYNGAQYIAETIESVLAQSYQNWKYVIADNCSTDETAAIAQSYADKDPRIEVRRNESFLNLIDNWNHALTPLPADAKYLKIIHADDWIFPDCLTEMVALAEQNPNVGIVSAFRLEENKPSLWGMPYRQNVIPGAEACRRMFAHEMNAFGSPSNILLRADLVRAEKPFYDTDYLHADKEVCFRLLEKSDFGFVFKMLTFTRRHNESQGSRAKRFNTSPMENRIIFSRYAHKYFTEEEYRRRFGKLIDGYYQYLSHALIPFRGKEFWTYQKEGLKKLGTPFSTMKLAHTAAIEFLDLRSTLKRVRNG